MQVGDPYIDHSYWTRPEDLVQHRPAYRLTKDKPGSDVIAETAAALAAGAIVFNSTGKYYKEVNFIKIQFILCQYTLKKDIAGNLFIFCFF